MINFFGVVVVLQTFYFLTYRIEMNRFDFSLFQLLVVLLHVQLHRDRLNNLSESASFIYHQVKLLCSNVQIARKRNDNCFYKSYTASFGASAVKHLLYG